MRPIRSAEEVVTGVFMTKADIRRLFRTGSDRASEIFNRADAIDRDEIKFRVFEDRVRTTSVCQVLGITLDELKRAYCNTPQRET